MNSVVKGLKLPNSPATEAGNKVSVESEDDELIGEKIQWPKVSASSSYRVIKKYPRAVAFGRLHRPARDEGFRPRKVFMNMKTH